MPVFLISAIFSQIVSKFNLQVCINIMDTENGFSVKQEQSCVQILQFCSENICIFMQIVLLVIMSKCVFNYF